MVSTHFSYCKFIFKVIYAVGPTADVEIHEHETFENESINLVIQTVFFSFSVKVKTLRSRDIIGEINSQLNSPFDHV